MSWFRMDDAWGSHPKVQACSPRARLLWVYGGLYCAQHLTDGVVPKAAMPMIVASAGVPRTVAAELVTAGLWIDLGDAYEVHHYLNYNPPRSKVTDEREKAAERQRKARDKARESRRDVTRDVTRDSQGESRSPRPDPTPTTYGCTHKSSSAEWTPDDDPATKLGLEDHLEAVDAGVRIINDDAHLAECIRRRREQLTDTPTHVDGLVPAMRPALPLSGRDAHANCGSCDGMGDVRTESGAWLARCESPT